MEPSKKVIIIQHKSEMVYAREFFEMQPARGVNLLFHTVCILCLSALAILVFGRIDDVVKADGIIRTRGNVSSVRNVISGTIRELNYKPGQKVMQGDVLYSLDTADYDVQKANLLLNKDYLEGRIAGNKALFRSFGLNENTVPPENETAYAQFESYLAEVEKLSIRESIAKQEYEKERNESEYTRIRYNIKMKKKEYDLAKSTLEAYKKSFESSLCEEKKDLEMQYEVLGQNLAQLENQYAYLTIKAPVGGYVQEISSLNIGDYVEKEAEVLNIVPSDSRNFRVEIKIPPKDIGKITVGRKVKYRLSAFPYFEYRGAEGTITSIDPDILGDSNGRLYYSVYGDIDRVEFSNRHGDTFPIRAGIETDARIVTGRSTILFYILKKMDFLY